MSVSKHDWESSQRKVEYDCKQLQEAMEDYGRFTDKMNRDEITDWMNLISAVELLNTTAWMLVRRMESEYYSR